MSSEHLRRVGILLAERDAAVDVGLVVAEVDAALGPVEDRRRDDVVAVGGVAVGDAA